MKRKIFIFALLIAGLAALAGHSSSAAPEEAMDFSSGICESEISSADEYSDSYIRYNCAFSSPSASALFQHRNGGTAGYARTINFCQQLTQRAGTDMVLKDGKAFGCVSVRCFKGFMDLFPSGKMSGDHHFIYLHKLLV